MKRTHLAICTEPFLSLMLAGQKKVESRFSRNKIAPYKVVARGDKIILKRSGGSVAGSCVVQKVKFFEIKNKKIFSEIRKKYSKVICAGADRDFWQQKKSAKYATFIWLGDILLEKRVVNSSGRSGWRILKYA